MAGQPASIVEVAKRAGVSVATASRVLSRSSYPVREDTRRKVFRAAKEFHYLRLLQDYRADGVIFAGSGLNESGYPEQLEAVVQAITGRGGAAVTLAQHTLHVPSIQPDNFGGARQMTERLIALGHRRIGFVTGPANVTTANVRLQGYMAAMIAAGLPIDPDLLLA